MARGNNIIVSGEPKGRFEEIIVAGTPKPGTIMATKTVALSGTVFTMEPAGTTAASGSRGMAADGDNIPIAVLLGSADHAAGPPGKTSTDAYVDGERGAVYYPVNGETLNVLKLDVSGTADDLAIGDKLIVDDGTGKVLLSAGSPESEPFECLETVTDPTADVLIWVKFTGN
jgi:hypothetical protein